MKPLNVVCALIVNNNGKFLACKRSSELSLGGKWEFPGGKIEPDESAEQALKREILEELEVSISIIQPLTLVRHSYPSFDIALRPFLCEIHPGEIPNPLVHAQIRWIEPAEANQLDWAEADIPILEQFIKQYY